MHANRRTNRPPSPPNVWVRAPQPRRRRSIRTTPNQCVVGSHFKIIWRKIIWNEVDVCMVSNCRCIRCKSADGWHWSASDCRHFSLWFPHCIQICSNRCSGSSAGYIAFMRAHTWQRCSLIRPMWNCGNAHRHASCPNSIARNMPMSLRMDDAICAT